MQYAEAASHLSVSIKRKHISVMYNNAHG
jgi:hypothetical protein